MTKEVVQPAPHRTLLVTAWQERGGESAEWRFMLQDPYSGKRQGFVSLKAFLEALSAEITATTETPKTRRSVSTNRRQP